MPPGTRSRVFSLDPAFKPDTSVYPPSFQRFAEDVRKAVKKLGTKALSQVNKGKLPDKGANRGR